MREVKMNGCKILELLSVVPIPALLFLSVQCFLHSVFLVFEGEKRSAIKFFLAGLCMVLYIPSMFYVYSYYCNY